jgi:hypothetical protein
MSNSFNKIIDELKNNKTLTAYNIVSGNIDMENALIIKNYLRIFEMDVLSDELLDELVYRVILEQYDRNTNELNMINDIAIKYNMDKIENGGIIPLLISSYLVKYTEFSNGENISYFHMIFDGINKCLEYFEKAFDIMNNVRFEFFDTENKDELLRRVANISIRIANILICATKDY